MRKYLIAWLMTSCFTGLACDNCNIYLGLNPNDFSSSIQFNYRWNLRFGAFNSQGIAVPYRHGGEHLRYANDRVKEYYSTYEIRGKHYFNPRLSVLVNVPIRNNYRNINGHTTADVYGLGDPVLLADYRLINSTKTDSTKFTHRLAVTAGGKIPLGKSDAEFEGVVLDHDMQLGSGSWDVIFGTNYFIRYRKFGWNSTLNYKLNATNFVGFKYGNATNWSSDVFYYMAMGKSKLLPQLGIYSEQKQFDQLEHEEVQDSKFNIQYVRIATALYRNKWSVRVEYLSPFNQLVQGQNLTQGMQLNAALAYYFK